MLPEPSDRKAIAQMGASPLVAQWTEEEPQTAGQWSNRDRAVVDSRWARRRCPREESAAADPSAALRALLEVAEWQLAATVEAIGGSAAVGTAFGLQRAETVRSLRAAAVPVALEVVAAVALWQLERLQMAERSPAILWTAVSCQSASGMMVGSYLAKIPSALDITNWLLTFQTVREHKENLSGSSSPIVIVTFANVIPSL